MWLRLLLVVAVGLAVIGCGAETGVGSDGRKVAGSPTRTALTVPPLHPSVDGYPEIVVTLQGPEGASRQVAVKVADTPERRQHGLMEVEDLPDGIGMLFVYEEEHEGGFWMKDTLMPLSIAFAASDGDILAILDMQPCEEDPCPVYDPEVRYRYTLEVPAGWFDREGIDEDWTLRQPLPAAGTPPGSE